MFDIVASNGFERAGATPAAIKQIQFEFDAANVAATVGTVSVNAAPTLAISMLLVTFGYLSGPGADISRVTLEGESFNIGATIGPMQLHAYAAAFNPALDQLGDNGNTSVLEWSSTAAIDGATFIDGAPGSTAANGGLNVLEIESATAQNLDFTTTLSSDPTTGNIKNVEVFDLTDGANPSTANNITLTANDVFQLAEHEPTAIQNAGGAAALWILGGANDTVNLAGTGSTWTQISAPVTQTGQAGGN